MGSFEFGIYVYVWTWVLLIGQSLDLGLATAAQRFIPEYREQKRFDHLRGYIAGSRLVAVGVALLVAALCAGLVRLLQPWLDDYTVIPLYLACAALPAYALSNVQDGISRSYDWVALGIVPTYIVRQLVLTAMMAAAYFAGFPLDAVTAMVLACLALWLPPLGQLVILKRRLVQPHRSGTEELRLQALDRHRAADPDGGRLLSAARAHGRADAAAIPAAGRSRGLLCRGEDAGLRELHRLLDRGDHGTPLQRLSGRRRSPGSQ